MMEEQIKNIFEKQGGVMRTKELSEHGIYYRKLRTLIEEGKVEKIRYGYYQWQDDKAFSEASLVAALFPEGILCMETALLYYDYTDRTPDAWHIAVDNRSGRTQFYIEHPKVRPHFVQQNRLDIGKSEGEVDGIKVNIYDRERVICDCLRHINRMDGEIFNEAIKRYVRDTKKNVAQLMEYAKKLGVENKVRRTVAIWL